MRLVCLLALAATVWAQQKSFVACPIVRDTKTVPCFLAEYEGELYYLGIQQGITADFHPPQLKHQVLVEGRVAEGPRVCGGVPLEPLTISVIKEINLACNTLLPAEPGIDAPPAPRGAGPSSRRVPEPSTGTAPAPRAPLTGNQEFTVLYAFDDDYLEFAANRIVTEAAAYAKRVEASAVEVTGYRATTLLSNGEALVEKAGLAEKRAQAIATLLRGLGVARVSVASQSEAQAGDGVNDPSRRRVTIRVTP
jgi:outer membrane protein OmpA-like peptidoglycan-associated protein